MALRDVTKGGRNQPGDDFVLKNVWGVSSASKDALAADPLSSNVAFAAASVLVFVDPRYSKQTFLENPSGRSIRAVAFSDDAKYVAFGEIGYNPHICIYNNVDRKPLCVIGLQGMCTVKALEFHPRSIYLAVACTNSYNVGLYDLKGRKLASATFVVEPLGMTLPKVGSYLVACGHRKLSLFSLTEVDTNLDMQMYPTNIVFDRRSVLLGYQSDYTFVDVTSGVGTHARRVYAVTSCGYLCDLRVGDIFIDRASRVDMQCFCVRYCFGCIFVGCAKNTIHICSPVNLSIVNTIHDRDVFSPLQTQPSIWKFEADAVSLVANRTTMTVTCIFSDHQIHSWQVSLNNNSMECNAIIPVDADGNKVAWQPTSYEMQSKVGSLLSYCGNQKSKTNPKEGGEKSAGLPEAFGLTGPGNKPLVRPSTAPFYVNATRFTPDGKTIICGNAEGEIRIFDAVTGRLDRVIEAHSSTVTHIELLFDDQFRLVASGGRDRVIFILNAQNGYSLVQILCDHSSAVVSISMANYSDTLTLVSSAADGVILIRRAIKGRQLRFVIVGELSEFGGKPRMYAHGSDFIITGGGNGHINLFQTDPFVSTRPTKTIKSGTLGKRSMRAVALDPSGCFLVTNSATGILIFNIHTAKHVATLSKMKDVSLVVFTDDCKYLVCESNEGCRFQWQLPKRMTEVMKAKMGGRNCIQRNIPFQNILSRMNLKEKLSMTNVEMTIVQDPTAYGQSIEKRAHMSKPPLQEEVKTTGILSQKSPSECDSYSTCNSTSRSCTDIADFSFQRSDTQPAESGDQRISDEARRLLCFGNQTSESASNVSVDKAAETYVLALNSTDKSKLTGISLQSTDSEVTREQSLLLENNTAASKTKPISRTFRFGNTKKTAKKALAKAQQKSNPSRNSLSSHLRNGNLMISPDAIVPLKSVQRADESAQSLKSEYISVGSEVSARQIVYFSDGLDQETIPPSDLVSEMNDFFEPAATVIEENTEISSADIDEPDPDSGSDANPGGLDFSPSLNKPSCPVATGERYNDLREKNIRGNWRDGSPDRSLRKKEQFSSDKETKAPLTRFKERIEIFKARLKDQLSEPEGKSPLMRQGEYETKGISKEADEGKQNGNDKGDFHTYRCNEPQNVNQNTDAIIEYENISAMNLTNMTINHRHDYFSVENPFTMKKQAEGADSKQTSGEWGDANVRETCREETCIEVLLPETVRQVTPLSNTQETFFDFQSELLDKDFIQDLAPLAIGQENRYWRKVNSSVDKRKINEDPAKVSEVAGIDDRCNRTLNTNFRPSEESEEHAMSVNFDDGKSTRMNPCLKEGRTDGDCFSPNAVERKDTLTENFFGAKSAEFSETFEGANLKTKMDEVGTETNAKECPDILEKCSCKIQQESTKMKEITSTSEPISQSKESKQCSAVEYCRKSGSTMSLLVEEDQDTGVLEIQNQQKRHDAFSAQSRPVGLKGLDGSGREPFQGKGEEDCLNLYHVAGAGIVQRAGEGIGKSMSPPSSLQQSAMEKRTIQDDTALMQFVTSPPRSAPSSPNPTASGSGRRSPRGIIIEGLGSVANLYRNQADYVRKLMEVRRNFEISIQALKNDKKTQSQKNQKQ